MYNSKVKERYLEQADYRDSTERFFNRSEFVESELKKDLYDFTEKNIDDLLVSLNTPSRNTLNLITSIFRQYTDWALANHLVKDGINHYKFFHLNEMDKYVNKFVAEGKKINYDQYKEIEHFIDNPFDRFVFQCLWHGIKGPCMVEISLAKLEDIDLENKEMKIYRINESGEKEYRKTVAISQTMIDTAIESSQTLTETIKNSAGLVNCPLEGETIIKRRVRKDVDPDSLHNAYNRLYQRFRKAIRSYGLHKVNPVDIMMSGMVYQLQELAKDKKMDLYDVLSTEEGRQILANYDVKYSNLPLRRKIDQYI